MLQMGALTAVQKMNLRSSGKGERRVAQGPVLAAGCTSVARVNARVP
jgi:hypothetical protein